MPAVGHFQAQSETQFQSKRLYMAKAKEITDRLKNELLQMGLLPNDILHRKPNFVCRRDDE